MKIIVTTKKEQDVLRRLFAVLHDADGWSDIQKADHSEYADEKPKLSLADYDWLRKHFNAHTIVVERESMGSEMKNSQKMNPLEKRKQLLEQFQEKKKQRTEPIVIFKDLGICLEENIFAEPSEVMDFASHVFDSPEIQYVRGLVMQDKLVNGYKEAGGNALIARNKTMHDFTEEILGKLDKLEDI